MPGSFRAVANVRQPALSFLRIIQFIVTYCQPLQCLHVGGVLFHDLLKGFRGCGILKFMKMFFGFPVEGTLPINIEDTR
jgi:hypothetical protein